MDIKELFKENMSVEEFEGVITKAVQSSNDKLRTDYSKQLKELENKLPKQMTDEEKAIQDRLTVLEQKEKHLEFKEKLQTKGLPLELLNLVGSDDHIELLSNVINQQKLNSGFIPSGHNQTNTGITKEQFKKMNYLEREKLQDQQPEIYKALTCSK